MRNYLFILLTSTLLFGACKKEDTNNTSMTLTGDWYKTDHIGFLPALAMINKGDIIWSFDANAQQVTIQNNSPTYSLYPSGTYSYTTTATTITFAFTGYNQTFDYNFINSELRLSDQPQLDGPILVFER